MLNSGDIGFMIIAATYVFLMTPGLAFFYGGLAQRKNVLNTMMMSVAFMGLSSVLWYFADIRFHSAATWAEL